MMKRIKHGLSFLGLTILAYILLLMWPNLLFSHQYQYQNFNIHSDKAIPLEIEKVLDDVVKRIQYSELYNKKDKFRIFICQKNWRFTLLTRNPKAGGVVNGILSSNAFIRSSNIETNALIPPSGWLYEAHLRPLSYFIAHELTHSMQSSYDRFMVAKVPPYIMEGYADYIGKRPAYNYELYKTQLLENHRKMDPANGLYNRYHLYIAYLMEIKGLSFVQILDQKPEIEVVLAEIANQESQK